MAANALKTINKIARTLKRGHPGMKHSSAIKQASAIYRRDQDKKSVKRTPAKKKDVLDPPNLKHQWKLIEWTINASE